MTSEADIASLLERVRSAEGADREFDGLIEVAVRWIEGGRAGVAPEHRAEWESDRQGWVRDPHTLYASAPVTASLDAALALVERVRPGWFVGFQQNRHYEPEAQIARAWCAWIDPPGGTADDTIECVGRTAPLTILAALLSSMQQEGEGNG